MPKKIFAHEDKPAEHMDGITRTRPSGLVEAKCPGSDWRNCDRWFHWNSDTDTYKDQDGKACRLQTLEDRHGNMNYAVYSCPNCGTLLGAHESETGDFCDHPKWVNVDWSV